MALRETPPSPFCDHVHVLGSRSACYDFDCKPIHQHNLAHHWVDTLLVVPANGHTPDDAAINKAKALSRTRIIDYLYDKFVVAPSRLVQAIDISPTQPCSSIVALQEQLNKYSDSRGHPAPEDYRKIIGNWVDERLAILRTQIVNTDITTGLFQRHNGSHQFTQNQMESQVLRNFSHMPEWLQVFANSRGVYTITDASNETLRKYSGEAYERASHVLPFLIFLNPNDYRGRGNEDWQVRTLREELIHQAHMYSSAKTCEDKLTLNEFNQDDLHFDFMTAAMQLAQEIRRDPGHPALTLIKKSESHGGSLLPAIKKAEPFTIATETLADMVDAEVYLRQKEKLSANDAEKRMRAAFGDKLYDLSRGYLSEWIELAADVVEKQYGKKQANACRAKWHADPLCHSIDFKQVPQALLQSTLAHAR